MNEFLQLNRIQKIYMGSGSRNAKLIESFGATEIEYGFDERALAFEALGFAKASGQPVAVCTTSGSAVAECLPAVIEAFYSRTPLMIISADRPARLRGTGAPQTIEQRGIFTDFIRGSFSGPIQHLKLKQVEFPFHLNIEVEDEFEVYPRVNEGGVAAIFCEGAENLLSELKHIQSLEIPHYIESLSGLRGHQSEHSIETDKQFVELLPRLKTIIKFGNIPVSKAWRLLSNEYQHIEVITYQSDLAGVPQSIRLDDLGQLKSSKKLASEKSNLEDLLKKYPQGEAALIHQWLMKIAPEDGVFVGNSMPIRYLDLVNKRHQKIFANRGANGIDGQISTAIGMAKATQAKIHALIGDLTYLYDLNSMVGEMPANLHLTVVNNLGGRIFERIKVHPAMILEHNLMELPQVGEWRVEFLMPDNEQTRKFWQELR